MTQIILRLLAVSLAGLALTFAACDGSTESATSGDATTATADTGTATAQCGGCGDRVCGVDDCGKPCGDCGSGTLCLGGACVAESQCDESGFEASRVAVFQRLTGGVAKLRYEATQGGIEPPYDKIIMEMVDGKAPTTAGDYELEDLTASGAITITGQRYCNDVECFNKYEPVSGMLKIVEAPEPGKRFVASIEGARFKQTEPVPADKFWCVDRLDIQADVPDAKDTQGTCVATGTGRGIGDNIADFNLINCATGEEVSLHGRCGKIKVMWFVASAGWCGACEAFVPKAYKRYLDDRDNGLDLAILYGETPNATPPSLAECKQYGERKGIDPSVLYLDNDGGRAWAATLDKIDNYATGSFGIPWNALLKGDSMEYMWSSYAGEGDLYSNIDALLGK